PGQSCGGRRHHPGHLPASLTHIAHAAPAGDVWRVDRAHCHQCQLDHVETTRRLSAIMRRVPAAVLLLLLLIASALAFALMWPAPPPGPIYTVAQVTQGMAHHPRAWYGHT